MLSYNLTKEEKNMFRRIDVPQTVGGMAFTVPVVVSFDKENNNMAGILLSLNQWRSIIECVPAYKDSFNFELRNMWSETYEIKDSNDIQ